jgi:alcohol dehydrogenase class IV
MRFEFATAGRIIFGDGTLQEVGPLAAQMGRRALVVTGKDKQRAETLLEKLDAAGVEVVTFSIASEPTTCAVDEGVSLARESRCDLVIGFGGGSPLDAGKAIAALLMNGGEALDYLEVVGRGKPLTQPSAPYIAIPTTAGTGSEVTRNAVLASPEHGVKASLRSLTMLPRLAVVDPLLTHTMSPAVTAHTGLDALTQLIEPFVSLRANPLTDAICREGMARVARSLRQAYRRGDDAEARRDMALASLCGGLALANAGLGIVHGLAGPIGGMFPAPHGAVCAALLPHAMAVNLRALEQRHPGSPAIARYAEIGQILTGRETDSARAGIEWVRECCTEMDIPPLAAFGVTKAHVPALVAKAAVASSTKVNPVALADEELAEILEQALQAG